MFRVWSIVSLYPVDNIVSIDPVYTKAPIEVVI